MIDSKIKVGNIFSTRQEGVYNVNILFYGLAINNIRVTHNKGSTRLVFPMTKGRNKKIPACFPINNELRVEIKQAIESELNSQKKRRNVDEN